MRRAPSRLTATVTALLAAAAATAPRPAGAVTVELEGLEKIPMYSRLTAKVRLSFDAGDGDRLAWRDGAVVTANLSDAGSWAVAVLNASLNFTHEDIRRSFPKGLDLYGEIIGYNNLTLWAGGRLLASREVYVVVHDKTLSDVFMLVLTLMVLVNTINMGAKLDLDIIREVFRKPVGPGVGFMAQFLFMPLFSFFVGWLLFDDQLFRLGLFVLGSSSQFSQFFFISHDIYNK